MLVSPRDTLFGSLFERTNKFRGTRTYLRVRIQRWSNSCYRRLITLIRLVLQTHSKVFLLKRVSSAGVGVGVNCPSWKRYPRDKFPWNLPRCSCRINRQSLRKFQHFCFSKLLTTSTLRITLLAEKAKNLIKKLLPIDDSLRFRESSSYRLFSFKSRLCTYYSQSLIIHVLEKRKHLL